MGRVGKIHTSQRKMQNAGENKYCCCSRVRLCELLEPLLLHPKFQDSYFWCLRDPELQFCIKIGPGNRNIKQLLECACSSSLALQALRGTRKCEKCHFAFLARQQLTTMFPILRVQVTWAEMTAMFHQLDSDLEVWQICLNLLFIPPWLHAAQMITHWQNIESRKIMA